MPRFTLFFTLRALPTAPRREENTEQESKARLAGADLRETAWFATDHRDADFSLTDLRQAPPCPPKHSDCHLPPAGSVDRDKPCLLEQKSGPCIGEDRLAEYDAKLAEFLVDLACEDDLVEDGSQEVADRYRLGCALFNRLRHTLKYEPDRPLLKHLAKGLHETSCSGMPKWGAETREDLWRLRLGESPTRIGSELCPENHDE